MAKKQIDTAKNRAKKPAPVYNWTEHYYHDSEACQRALRILEAVETKKDKKKE